MQNITSAINEINNLRNAQIERFETLGKSLDAVKDIDGRYHAPKGGCYYEDNFYIGGQYLPFDDAFKGIESKVMIELNDFSEIKETMKNYAAVSHGKTWERDNKIFAYIYFIGWQGKKVVEAIEAYYTEKANNAPKKAIGDAPVGKTTVQGKILNLRGENGLYGFQLKMLVELENGSKVYGTAPKGQFQVGDKITFKADFTTKEHGFAFFKRPSLINVQTRL